MVLIFPSTNPASRAILGKQRGNNALATTPNAMPMKFYPSDNGTNYSANRNMFKKSATTIYTDETSYIQKTYTDNSSYLQRKKAAAIGKQSTYSGNFAFKSNVNNDRKKALRRVRAGGSVVPMKKRNKGL